MIVRRRRALGGVAAVVVELEVRIREARGECPDAPVMVEWWNGGTANQAEGACRVGESRSFYSSVTPGGRPRRVDCQTAEKTKPHLALGRRRGVGNAPSTRRRS